MTGKVRPLFRRRSAKLGELNGFVEENHLRAENHKSTIRSSRPSAGSTRKNEEAVNAITRRLLRQHGRPASTSSTTSPWPSSACSALPICSSACAGQPVLLCAVLPEVSGPINEAANIISELQSSFAAAERIFRLIDEEPEPRMPRTRRCCTTCGARSI
jgi:ATP-binding cassette subfamily B protein